MITAETIRAHTTTDFEAWQRKFLMHCMKVAKLDVAEAMRSADRLEAVGSPLLDGLTDKVRRVVEKAKAEGRL